MSAQGDFDDDSDRDTDQSDADVDPDTDSDDSDEVRTSQRDSDSDQANERQSQRVRPRYPNARWMATNGAARILTPAQFCFPGTHDSGAYRPPQLGPVVSDAVIARSRSRFSPRMRSGLVRWSVAQPGSRVYAQLVDGARFLELKVASYVYTPDPDDDDDGQPDDDDRQPTEPVYYLTNTFAMSLLEDVLHDIAQFVVRHPTELVMVAVRPTYHVNDFDLMQFVEGILGKFMLLNDVGNSTFSKTISEIVKSRKPIVGIYERQKATKPGKTAPKRTHQISKKWFLYDELFYASKRTKDKPVVLSARQTALKGELLQDLNATAGSGQGRVRRKMFILQYTLLSGYIPGIKSRLFLRSLVSLAKTMNPTLEMFVMKNLSHSQRAAINVITVDLFKTSHAVEIAKSLLQERTSKWPQASSAITKPSVTPKTNSNRKSHKPVKVQQKLEHQSTHNPDTGHDARPSSPMATAENTTRVPTTQLLSGSGLVVALLVVVYYLRLQ